MVKATRLAAALALSGALVASATTSNAAPVMTSAALVKESADSHVTDVRWRGGFGPAFGFGLLGAAIAAPLAFGAGWGPGWGYAPAYYDYGYYRPAYSYAYGPSYAYAPGWGYRSYRYRPAYAYYPRWRHRYYGGYGFRRW